MSPNLVKQWESGNDCYGIRRDGYDRTDGGRDHEHFKCSDFLNRAGNRKRGTMHRWNKDHITV